MKNFSTPVALLALLIATIAVITVSNTTLRGQRIDLTQDRLYSISPGTRSMLDNLEQKVDLTFFYSEKDSTSLGFLRDYASRIQDLLHEYELRSDGMLRVSVVDPEPFSAAEDAAAAAGLQRVTLQLGDPPLFFGITVKTADAASASDNSIEPGLSNEETITFLHPDRESFLEYDISKIIHKVTREREPRIGLISGSVVINGGLNAVQQQPSQPYASFTQLRQLYAIDALAQDINEIPSDIDLLLITHPKQLPENLLYAIDQYALAGGSILLFVDGFAQMDTSAPMLGPGSNASQMSELLSSWGLELVENKVLGDAAHALRVGGGSTQRPTPHLAVLGYGQQNFTDTDHPILQQLNNIIFSSAGVIQPLPEATTHFEALIQSSDQAGLLDASQLQNLVDPNQLLNGFEASGERYTLMAHVTGNVQSAYPDGRPSQDESADTSDVATSNQNIDNSDETSSSADNSSAQARTDKEISDPQTLRPHLLESAAPLNLIVFSDTDVLSDPLWVRLENFFGNTRAKPFADNGNLFINTAESALGSMELMSLRSRGTFSRPYHVVEQLERDAQAQFQRKEQELQLRLQETENNIAALQQQKDGDDVLTLSPEQEQEIQNFRAQQLDIRKDLREVQHQLGKDIESLGGWLKFLNIAAMPLLITAAVLLFRRRRRQWQPAA